MAELLGPLKQWMAPGPNTTLVLQPLPSGHILGNTTLVLQPLPSDFGEYYFSIAAISFWRIDLGESIGDQVLLGPSPIEYTFSLRSLVLV